jgi:hypothetical protein
MILQVLLQVQVARQQVAQVQVEPEVDRPDRPARVALQVQVRVSELLL